MKFSMIYEAQIVETDRAAEAKVFHEIIEQCLLAEQLDFNGVWAVEHTALSQYAHMSAPETFLAFLAGKTERLEIGHGVICLPPAMNHPIKVAERVATLDILSKGRVNFGVGKGGTQQEAGAFGYDLNALQPMIDESMYLIPKIFMEEEIEHDGTYIKIPRRPIHPKPYQQPHPRMYMACTRADSLVTAGSRGLGALVLGFGGPEDIAKKNAIYREAFANRKPEDQVGYRPTEHLAALCPTIVLEDRERARRVGLRGQRFFAESLAHWYQGGPKPTVDDLTPEEHRKVMEGNKQHVVAYLSEEKIPVGSEHVGVYGEVQDAYGTADDCIAYVQRLFDAGADEILFLSQMGTVPQDAILETIENIGRKVIPHFRDKQKARLAAE
jgi:alkanesulfonate monooxygenase SsuD/methylene tetrahydromethanopterin reductase-like flavin-dependent oxidoreductase (luciferase family)